MSRDELAHTVHEIEAEEVRRDGHHEPAGRGDQRLPDPRGYQSRILSPAPPIAWKDRIMPVTVPNRPMRGRSSRSSG